MIWAAAVSLGIILFGAAVIIADALGEIARAIRGEP